VLINGSRAHVPKLTEACPQAEIVEVTASEPVIRQRLRARGRESEAAIEARLHRNRALADGPAALRIANEGRLDEAVEALLAWARGVPQPTCQD
jgi:ribose 1,5-bisphosphokinase